MITTDHLDVNGVHLVVDVPHRDLEDALSTAVARPKAESSGEIKVNGQQGCQDESESGHY